MSSPPDERPKDNYSLPPPSFNHGEQSGRRDGSRHEPSSSRAPKSTRDAGRSIYGVPQEVRSEIKPQTQSTQVSELDFSRHFELVLKGMTEFQNFGMLISFI